MNRPTPAASPKALRDHRARLAAVQTELEELQRRYDRDRAVLEAERERLLNEHLETS
jgi:hypothetical protein